VIYVFGDYTLDTQLHALHCARQPIGLRPKVFLALSYLLAHRDRIVSKQELCEQVWPDQFVSDAALDGTIKAVRQAIGDSGRRQQFIQTIYSVGYRLPEGEASVHCCRMICRLTCGASLPSSAAKVEASLDEVGLGPEPRSPFLQTLFGVPVSEDVLATPSPQAVKARTIEALVQLVLHGARRRPLVVEVENLHWIDPSSEEVLTALVERLTGAPILLLLTYRPGYRPPWLDKPYATQMALPQLAPRECRSVVQAIVQPAPVSQAVVQTILARAGGNLFFLEELAHMVVEQRNTHPAEGLPTTIESVLTARIDRLLPEAKHLLQIAAVIGKDSAMPLLQAVAEVPEAAIQRALTHLQTAELLYETARGADRILTFKHVLIQEAAYQSLLRSTRQQVHQRIALALEVRFPETVETQPELLAHHYTEASLIEQAIPYWQHASQGALERSANLEAIGPLIKGLDLLKMLPDTPGHTQQELALLTSLGAPLVMVKGYAAPEVQVVYSRAREICQHVGETPQLSPVLWGLWMFYFVRGELETGRALGEQLLHLAQSVQDPALLLEAYMALGAVLTRLGELTSARAHLEQSIALYHPLQHWSLAFRAGQDTGIACLSEASYTLWMLGYPHRARQRNHEALTLAQERAHPFSVAFALSFAALVHQHRGEVQLTQERAEAAVTLSSEHGFPLWLGIGTVLRGWALAMQGQGEEGIAQMHQGLMAWQATGAELTRPYCLALLAEAYGTGGQAEEGLSVIDEAFGVVSKTGERCCEAELYRLRGALLRDLSADHQAEVERCFRQALAVARHQHAKSLELRAALSLSRLWQGQGKRKEAYQLLTEMYGWFTEGFDTADLQEAKALLEELS